MTTVEGIILLQEDSKMNQVNVLPNTGMGLPASAHWLM